MRTREKSKAQLVRELKEALEVVHDREAQIYHLQKDITSLNELRELLNDRTKERNALNSQVYDLKQAVQRLEQEKKKVMEDRDGWKSDTVKANQQLREMRQLFFQQAALAGKLADQSYLTVAPTRNFETL